MNSVTIDEIPKSQRDRVLGKIKQLGPDDCWEWTGAKTSLGYGKVMVNGKTIGAHRISYLLSRGSILSGLEIMHKCDNPPLL